MKARLPLAAKLLRMLFPRSHCARISSRGLRDYYFLLRTNLARRLHQGWVPRVPWTWFAELENEDLVDVDIFDLWWEPDLASFKCGVAGASPPKEEFVQPVADVLLMGDLNAVVEGEEFHLGVARHYQLLEGAQSPGKTEPWRRGALDFAAADGRACVGEGLLGDIYLDDLALIALVPWGAKRSETEGRRRGLLADRAYALEDLARSPGKDRNDVPVQKMWGPELDGDRGVVGSEMQWRVSLMAITVALVHRPWVLGSTLASALGCWSAVLQYRRPAYSVLQDPYTFSASVGPRKKAPLPGPVVTEMVMLTLLGPALQTCVRSSIRSQVCCTDASLTGAGACEAVLGAPLRVALFDLAEGKGEYVRLDQKITMASTSERIALAKSALILVPQKWRTVTKFRFRSPAHINILELAVAVSYIRSVVRQGCQGCRVIVCAVVKGCGTKGRSSSRALNRGLRKLAASCLTYNILLELVWVPTWANPGDAPSRDAPLGDWRKKAVPFWEAIRDAFRDGHSRYDSSALSALMASAPVSEPAPAEESAAFGAELPLVDRVLLDQMAVERKTQSDESFEPPCRGPWRLRHIDQCLSSSGILENRDLKPCHAKAVSGLDYVKMGALFPIPSR